MYCLSSIARLCRFRGQTFSLSTGDNSHSIRQVEERTTLENFKTPALCPPRTNFYSFRKVNSFALSNIACFIWQKGIDFPTRVKGIEGVQLSKRRGDIVDFTECGWSHF